MEKVTDHKNPKKIMIVEDEFVVAEDIRECLENMGYFVSSAVTSGEDALEKIEEEMPDMILMDIVLSGDMDGIETAERIHEHHQIPIIFITAHSDEDMLKRAKITEPYGYILKPFDDRDIYINLEMAFYRAKRDRSRMENEEKYRAFVEGTHDPIVRLDHHGRFMYINPAAEKLFNRDSRRCIGSSLPDLIHPEDRERTEKVLLKWIKKKGIKDRDDYLVNRIIDPQGGIHDMLWRISCCFDDQGNLAGLNCIASDITRMKKTEEELKKINNHLRESLAKIKRLTGCSSICGHCKRIRDEKGQWRYVEEYIRTFSDEGLIHTICIDCLKEIYPDMHHKHSGKSHPD